MVSAEERRSIDPSEVQKISQIMWSAGTQASVKLRGDSSDINHLTVHPILTKLSAADNRRKRRSETRHIGFQVILMGSTLALTELTRELLHIEEQFAVGGFTPLPAFFVHGKGAKLWVGRHVTP